MGDMHSAWQATEPSPINKADTHQVSGIYFQSFHPIAIFFKLSGAAKPPPTAVTANPDDRALFSIEPLQYFRSLGLLKHHEPALFLILSPENPASFAQM
ncbi:hypothetical protein N7537_008241 [Penicillium hordei]|uniref:Uncharacterized protein n=1 Tax=Penicillium hordei TaxID=40994 RepID=A0AAD6GZD3_9EURO|nr:uncharacterized protein N7537_008241 [Penicillium hordei]KAJ5598157.1 hypothetical protein N7537_008241 [Penicillium hordei]